MNAKIEEYMRRLKERMLKLADSDSMALDDSDPDFDLLVAGTEEALASKSVRSVKSDLSKSAQSA